MIFEVFISGVDGETNVSMSAPRLTSVREFLAQRDHEGSDVTLRVLAEGEEAFEVLHALEVQGAAAAAVRFK